VALKWALPQGHPTSQITSTMTDRSDNDRRNIPDRRAGSDRRAGRDRRRIEDRNNARRLPDEFAQSSGGSDHRITGLVNRYWASYEEPDRGQLTKALRPVLEELTVPGVPVTDEHRERCVEVVVEWASSLEPAPTD